MVSVVGYGSLMIPESLQKTIPAKECRLVWVDGHKRIFNLKTRLLKLYKVLPQSNEVAVLNVEPAVGSGLNAVLFEASDEEFEKLKIREKIYYTKEVEVSDFHSGMEIGKAAVFVGKKMLHGERVVSNDYLPIAVYLERCREAAYTIGEDFGRAFDKTTFLGNGMSVLEYSEQKSI